MEPTYEVMLKFVSFTQLNSSLLSVPSPWPLPHDNVASLCFGHIFFVHYSLPLKKSS